MKKKIITIAFLGIAHFSNAQDGSKSQLLINHLGFGGQGFPNSAMVSLGYLHKVGNTSYLRLGAGFSKGSYNGFGNRIFKGDTIVDQNNSISSSSPKFSLGLEKRFAITKKATFFYGADAVVAINLVRQNTTNTTQVSGAIISETKQSFLNTTTHLQAQAFMGVRYNFTPGFFVSYQVSNALFGNTWQNQHSSFSIFPYNPDPIPFTPRQTLSLGFRLKK
jgi:hypothetical protein